jgi:hypothetical protein
MISADARLTEPVLTINIVEYVAAAVTIDIG